MQTNEFLNNVCEKIKYKPIRNEISEELKNHIEEQKEAFIQSGIEENVAECLREHSGFRIVLLLLKSTWLKRNRYTQREDSVQTCKLSIM